MLSLEEVKYNLITSDIKLASILQLEPTLLIYLPLQLTLPEAECTLMWA
jgi:hypothetical protein